MKQFLTFVNAAPLQPAVAVALALPDGYYTDFRDGLQAAARPARRRAGRRRVRRCCAPEGTYFVTADITALGGRDGVEFCRSLPERCGVVAVPTQVFYDDAEAGRRLVRFAFCKRPEVLDRGGHPAARADPTALTDAGTPARRRLMPSGRRRPGR